MANDKIKDLLTLDALVVDFSVGDLGVGGEPPTALYPFTVKEAGFQPGENGEHDIALTLDMGGRDQFAYVSLPTNPNSKHFGRHQQELVTFLRCIGAISATENRQLQLNGQWLKQSIVGKSGHVWYEARERKPDGTAYDGKDGGFKSYAEFTFLTPGEDGTLAKVQSGKLVITRYKKAASAATPNSLGSAVAALPAAVGAVAAPVAAGVPQPVAPVAAVAAPVAAVAAPVATAAPGLVAPTPPAPVVAAPLAGFVPAVPGQA